MFTAAAIGAGELRGETHETDVTTLSGLDQVIVITTTDDTAAGLGVEAGTMSRFIVRRLTTAGVGAATVSEARVAGLTIAENTKTLFLEVSIEVLKLGPIHVFLLRLEAHQWAHLAASGETAMVCTRRRAFFGSLGTGDTRLLRQGIEGLLDSFAKDWATAHKAVDEPVADPFAEPGGVKK